MLPSLLYLERYCHYGEWGVEETVEAGEKPAKKKAELWRKPKVMRCNPVGCQDAFPNISHRDRNTGARKTTHPEDLQPTEAGGATRCLPFPPRPLPPPPLVRGNIIT